MPHATPMPALLHALLSFIAVAAGAHAATGTCASGNSGTAEVTKILGYVTPWNARGYDVAKQHKEKFSHISPVWYQLKVQDAAPVLTGGHDVDAEWIVELREPKDEEDRVPRIVPRVVVEMQPEQHIAMLTVFKTDVIQLLVRECKRNRFEGLVLEVWYTWHAMGLLQQHFALAKSFLQSLARSLHKQDGYDGLPMELILAMPPPVPAAEGQPAPISTAQFSELEHFIDGFSLMTYDHNGYGSPGPNAPLPWVQANLKQLKSLRQHREKLLLGLNFYGREFSASGVKDVLGNDYREASALDSAVRSWDEAYQEHVLLYKKAGEEHVMFYPSVESTQARVSLAQGAGAGLAIWELGQGLDELMDVLALEQDLSKWDREL